MTLRALDLRLTSKRMFYHIGERCCPRLWHVQRAV